MRRAARGTFAVGLFAGALLVYALTRGDSFSPDLEREVMSGSPSTAYFSWWLALWEMGLVREMPRAGDQAYNIGLVEEGMRLIHASGDPRSFCRQYSAKILAGELRDAPSGSAEMDAFVVRAHRDMVQRCAVEIAMGS